MALTRPKIWDLDTNIEYFKDPLTTLNQGSTSANVDVGFIFNRANGLVSNVALYWSESTQSFVTAFTANTGITNSNVVVTTYANVTTGHLIPGANVTYNLGSPTQRWKDLWLSGTTIYLGGATISSPSPDTVIISNQNGGSFGVTGSAPGQASGTFGNIIANSGITSTSTSTGALQVIGGVGINGNLYVGGNLVVTGTTLFTNTETIITTEYVNTINATNLYASTIGNAGATLTGTLSTAAQTNITSLGTLTALNITNVGDVSSNIGTLVATATAQTTSINTINANVGSYQNTTNANIGTVINNLQTLNANVGSYQNTTNANIGTVINNLQTLNANVGSYQNTTNANIGTVINNLQTLNANVGSYQNTTNANIGTIVTSVTSLYTNANANTAAYISKTALPIGTTGTTYTGSTLNIATWANIAGPLVVTNNTAIQAIQVTGTSTKGGAGYHDFLLVTNQGGGTNPNKTFRLNSTGGLEIINSAYSNNLFTLSDSGDLNIPGRATVGNITTTNGVFWSNGAPYSSGSGSGGSAPAGNSGQVQYNSGGTLGASTLYYWSNNNAITTTSTVNTGALTATTLTGALQTAAQPNITSVGTLTGLTLSGALTQSSTTAGTITSVLTHGADVNFQLTSQNGTSLNTTGQEVARFGINYNTAGWDSFTQYIRGSAAQNGNQVLWAANTAIATISTSGITLNTGTFTGTIGTSGANTTVAGGLVVAGNLYAQGTLTYVNTETVNATEYVATINATNVYATTVGNIGANHVGTGTYLTSLNASNLSSGTVSASLIPTLNQNTTGSAGSLSGFGNPTTSSTASTIVYRDTNGYITNNYFYTSGGGAERNASGMGYFAGFNSSDYYIRSYSPAAVAAAISGQTMNIVGSASTATSASTAGSTAFFSAPDGDRNAATKLPTTSGHGVRGDFVSASSAGMAGGNYAGVLTYAPWDGTTASTGDASYQLAFGSTATNGSGYPQLNLRKGIDSTWNSWYNIHHSGQTNLPSADNTWNLGSSTLRYATVYGVTFSGVSTTAKYADLAENYISDSEYAPGTVVVFGGNKEITISTQSHDTTVAGIISTNPAYLMNSEADGLPVALTGRVPCQVQGPVTKGQVLVTSETAGVAQAIDNSQYLPGCVIGKALEAINTNTIETIEVVVGRF